MPVSYRQNFIPGSVQAMPQVDRSGRFADNSYYYTNSDGTATATTDVGGDGIQTRVTWDDGRGTRGVDYYYPDGQLLMSSYTTNGQAPVYTVYPSADFPNYDIVDWGYGWVRVDVPHHGEDVNRQELWFDVSGRYGGNTYHTDGTRNGWENIGNERWSYNRDGSSRRYESYTEGAGGDRINRTITTDVDPQGRLSRVSWTVEGPLSTGQSSSGETIYHPDGSRESTSTTNTGARSTITVDAQGNYRELHYAPGGALSTESYLNVDGRRGNKQYFEQGGYVAYDFEPNGSYLHTHDDGQGHVTRQWYTADNQPFDPNASTSRHADQQADALVGALASFGAGAEAGGGGLASREESVHTAVLSAATLA